MRRILTGTMAVNYPISLILKGVSSEITTKEILASKLSISAVRIRRFDWFSDRVEASIKGNYTLPSSFANNTSLTDLLDVGGNIYTIANAALQGCTSLVNVKFDNAFLSNSALAGVSSLTNALYSGVLKVRQVFNGSLTGTQLKKVIIDTGSVSQGSMQSMPNLEEVYLPGLTTIEADAFNGSSKLSKLNTSDVMSISNRAFSSTGFVNLSFPKIVNLTGLSVFNGINTLKTIEFDSLVNISTSESLFSSCPLLEYISMKKVKTYGTYNNITGASARFYGFNNVKLGCIIDCNIALATANTTNNTAHEALKWVKANRQAVVKFYDDNGNYVSTL